MPPLYPSFTPTYHHEVYPAIDPSQPDLDCSDKVILITGAGQGIGKAIARSFAQANAKGIALLGRTETTLAETAAECVKLGGGKTEALVLVTDITQPSSVEESMQKAFGHFTGGIDVLVNNAGGRKAAGTVADVDLDGLKQTYELNVYGPLNVTQAFIRFVKQGPSATKLKTVINISSGGAHIPYAPESIAYSTSKLAITKIMEYLHYENPDWHIFNMQPGVVDTAFARSVGRKASDNASLPGGFAVWLTAHPDAIHVNGKFIWANWDINEVLARKDEIKQKDLLTIALKGWADDTNAVDLMARAASVHQDANKIK